MTRVLTLLAVAHFDIERTQPSGQRDHPDSQAFSNARVISNKLQTFQFKVFADPEGNCE